MNFYDWFHELEGYGLRAERFYEEFGNEQAMKILPWLKAAYEQGREHYEQENKGTR